MTKRTWLCVALAILLLFVLALAAGPARADGPDAVHGVATVYGPPLNGPISRDGEHWERFNGLTTISVASHMYERGVPVCVRFQDELACRDEFGDQLTFSDWCPECRWGHIDLSLALIRDRFGYCETDETPRHCMARWGRQQITYWIANNAGRIQ